VRIYRNQNWSEGPRELVEGIVTLTRSVDERAWSTSIGC